LAFAIGVFGLNVRQLDRHNNYRQLEGFYFPHYEDPRLPLKNSLVDGELVLDVDPQTQRASEPYPPLQLRANPPGYFDREPCDSCVLTAW